MISPTPKDEALRKEAMINLSLPYNEKNHFKAWCDRQGYNMREALRHLIRQAMNDNRPLPEK